MVMLARGGESLGADVVSLARGVESLGADVVMLAKGVESLGPDVVSLARDVASWGCVCSTLGPRLACMLRLYRQYPACWARVAFAT